jgi:hypothetical protein
MGAVSESRLRAGKVYCEPGGRGPVLTGQEATWYPEPIWPLWSLLTPAGNRT